VRLHKNTGLKALIVGVGGGLLVLFLALIRLDPRIEAESNVSGDPLPDYERFFQVPDREEQHQPPTPAVQPHTRTRAS
jgi:hypothetical protein